MEPTGGPLDDVMRYWDNRPCNIRHSDKPIGTSEYFDEVEKRKYFVEPHIPGFAEFRKWDGKRVLEVGCGIGTDTINFARNGADVYAIDISKNSLEIAMKRAEVFGLQNRIKFIHASGENLQEMTLPTFDLIYSFGVIHHSPHPEKILKGIAWKCMDDTDVRVMVYHKWSWKVLSILLSEFPGSLRDIDKTIATYSEAQTGCPITYSYSKHGVRNFFMECGLDIVSMEVNHIFPYRVPEYTTYRYRKEPWFEVMPDWLFSYLEHKLGWHILINARKA